MTYHTFEWPNKKKSHLEFDVEVDGSDWKIVGARKWAIEFCEWLPVPLEFINRNIWGEFITDSVANMKLSVVENESVDNGKDQKLFEENNHG